MPEVNSLKSASDILAAGRKIQQGQIRTISENIANANATANNPGGVPYSRKIAVFSPIVPDSDDDPVGHIVKDTTPFRTRYDPSNVAASEKVSSCCRMSIRWSSFRISRPGRVPMN